MGGEHVARLVRAERRQEHHRGFAVCGFLLGEGRVDAMSDRSNPDLPQHRDRGLPHDRRSIPGHPEGDVAIGLAPFAISGQTKPKHFAHQILPGLRVEKLQSLSDDLRLTPQNVDEIGKFEPDAFPPPAFIGPIGVENFQETSRWQIETSDQAEHPLRHQWAGSGETAGYQIAYVPLATKTVDEFEIPFEDVRQLSARPMAVVRMGIDAQNDLGEAKHGGFIPAFGRQHHMGARCRTSFPDGLEFLLFLARGAIRGMEVRLDGHSLQHRVAGRLQQSFQAKHDGLGRPGDDVSGKVVPEPWLQSVAMAHVLEESGPVGFGQPGRRRLEVRRHFSGPFEESLDRVEHRLSPTPLSPESRPDG